MAQSQGLKQIPVCHNSQCTPLDMGSRKADRSIFDVFGNGLSGEEGMQQTRLAAFEV